MDQPKEIEWTPELVKKFWNYYGSDEHHQETYFSLQKGPTLLRYLNEIVDDFGRVADYGAGPGHLLKTISNQCASFVAFDYSQDSLKALTKRFASTRGFEGAFPIESAKDFEGQFDTVFCLETFEHLFDEQIETTMTTLRAFLKPGGRVIITVPNDEDLQSNMVYCPVSDVVYHRWQHMQSWQTSTMRETAERSGLVTEHCEAVNLHQIKQQHRREDRKQDREKNLSRPYKVARTVLHVLDLRNHLLRILNIGHDAEKSQPQPTRQPPNLIYVGSKRLDH